MTNLVRAKELLLHGDMLSSLDFFYKAVEENCYSDSEKLFILDSICELSNSLDKVNSLKNIESLAKSYYEVSQYKKSLLSCKEALKLCNKFELYELQIQNHKKLGHVAELVKSIESFLKLLIKKRDTKKTLKILSDNESVLTLSNTLKFKLKCYIVMGDIDSIEKVISELKMSTSSDIEEIIGLLESDTLYWHKSEIIRNWLVHTLAEVGFKTLVTKKYIIKLLSDYFYHSKSVGDEQLKEILIICEKWSLYGLGYTVAQIVKDENKENMFLSQLPKVLIMEEVFDLGDDFVSQRVELTEQEHYNKICFLETIGKKAEAVKETRSFDKKFPDSVLMSKGREDKNQKLSKADFLKTLEEISKRGASNQKNSESVGSYVSFEFDNKNELLENYSEIASSLNMLREYDRVVVLMDKLLEQIDEGEIYIDIVYLKIEALLKLERFFEARDIAERILLSNSLSFAEKRTFDYLLAESYFLLKEYKKAKYIFTEIYKNNKAYRLTENRLKYIEENQ